jgi:hypothetical protein
VTTIGSMIVSVVKAVVLGADAFEDLELRRAKDRYRELLRRHLDELSERAETLRRDSDEDA